MIELVWACDEERRRTHTEESVEDGYTRGRPNTRWKYASQRDLKNNGPRAGEEKHG